MQKNIQKRLSYIILGCFLFITIIFGYINQMITTDQLPLGIVSFELLWHEDNGIAAIKSLSTQQQLLLSFSLGLDYLYILSYGYLLLIIGQWAGIDFRYRVITIGLLDALENAGLILFLITPTSYLIPIASACALLKFLGILWLLGWALYCRTRKQDA